MVLRCVAVCYVVAHDDAGVLLSGTYVLCGGTR